MLERPVPEKPRFPIESLLSARLLLEPQNVDDRVFFLSDMSGVLSLYSMDKNGSIPEPLLPGGLALVNPHIMPGDTFHVVPKLGKILVMIDKMGNENYQPCLIPINGGIPEPLLGDSYANEQIACVHFDKDRNVAYFFRDNRKTPEIECLRVNLETREVTSLGTSIYGNICNGVSSDDSTVILADGYTAGDTVLYYRNQGMTERKLLYGTPLEERKGQQVPLTGIGWCSFVENNAALLFSSTIFHDAGGLTYLKLDDPSNPSDVTIKGLQHSGQGEMVSLRNVEGNLFVLEYNIDGATWAYEGTFHNSPTPVFEAKRVLVGKTPLSGGVALGLEWQITNHNPLLVEYVHGGPQGQERPDFTWFSMPLIQYLTLNGFAVFVPNVRGSTGYGMKYMKWVDKDWGGKDVQDHVDGLKLLEKDLRIDSSRRGVVGRSYGGYMTLTLASRHPELWKAAVDMFGPYDLPTWVSRIPPTWQTYFKLSLGDPVKDRDFLVERSPKTYMNQLSAPLMIIQGKHDPRVPEPESAQLVSDLRKDGVNIDYLVYEDEGHDVLRFKNRVHCYNTITDFFRKNLGS